MKNDMFLICFE